MRTFGAAVVYIAVTFALGIISNKKNKNLQHFLVARNQLNFPLCAALLLASTFAGAYTTGSARDAYLSGFEPYLPIAALGASYILFIPMVRTARGLGEKGLLSVPEVFRWRYGEKVGKAVMVINCIEYGALFAVQPIAFSNIVSPMLRVPADRIVWISALLLSLLAMMGLTGVAWMNAVHCLTMIGGMTAVSLVAISRTGGLSHIAETVRPGTFDIFRPDLPTSLAYFFTTSFYSYCASETYTAAMSAKKEKSAKLSCLAVGVIVFIFTALLMMIGISARVLLPEIRDADTVLYRLTEYLGPVFMICGSIAVLAAIASSAPAYLIYFSTNVTQAVLEKRSGDSLSERKKRLLSSAVIMLLAFGGTFLARRASSILYLLFNVTTVQSFSGFVLFAGMVSRRISGRTAFISITAATCSGFLWMFLGNPFGIIPAVVAFPVGGLLLILMPGEKGRGTEGTAFLKPENKEGEIGSC